MISIKPSQRISNSNTVYLTAKSIMRVFCHSMKRTNMFLTKISCASTEKFKKITKNNS